jgi:hypothetical protein
MLPFLSCTHICHPHTPLKGESPSEEKSSLRSPLLVSAPVLEHGKQQPLVDESPTEESYEPLLANSTSTPYLNSSILVVDVMNLPIAQRKGAISCTQHPIFKFVSYQHLSLLYRSFVSKLSSVSIPQNLQEAISDPKCRKAIQKEMIAIHKNNTWELVKLPSGKKAVWMQMSVYSET